MSRKNGGIIGPANTPVGGLMSGVAGGVWRMNDVLDFVSNSQWPSAPQNIENATRFDDGSSDNLSRTLGTATNRKKFTLSFWIKKTVNGVHSPIIECASGGGSIGGTENAAQIYFNTSDQLTWFETHSGAVINLSTNAVFRDNSAWYHIMYAIDTTQGTNTNRLKLYVNGVQETSFTSGSGTYPSENLESYINSNQDATYIGRSRYSNKYFDGYMAEFVLVDGTTAVQTDLGETNSTTGLWTPRKIGAQFATVGTNTFYLDFKDSSNLGNDASGKSNDFTVNNLTSTDQTTDTCVENFATLQPNLGPRYSTQTFSNGNLSVSGGSGFEFHPSTIGMTSGKYYFEAKITTLTNYPSVGIIASHQFETNNQDAQSNSQGYVMHFNGQFNNGGVVSYTGTAMSAGDIIMIAFDSGNGVIWFGLNGTWQKSATQSEIEAGTTTNAIFTNITNAGSDSYHFLVQNYGSAWDANFGNPPFSISSGNSDANGFGNFEYSVPSGYYALNTSNLNTYG